MSEEAKNFGDTENLCVVCFKNVEIYSIGVCEHAVCFECSTRMRVLCRQNECPICRQDMPKVIFTKIIEPYNKLIQKAQKLNWQDRKYGLYFLSQEIQNAYYQLLEYRCPLCEDHDKNYFRNFIHLKDHVRKVHEQFYCEICVENLKIFSFERRTYTRQQLALHRRKGDPDNTSHRGHPLCEFCDTRFMDSDELFRHLRRNHLFCHFCDADGKHQYYNSMEDLKHHFQEEHYLCEEGECKNMPLTAVFRDDIDLKAHFAREHSKNLSKLANKQARTLDLEFTIAPRPRADNFRNRRPVIQAEEESMISHSMEPGGGPGGGESRMFVNPLTPQNFPALGNITSNITVQSRPTSSLSFTSKINPLSAEDFPSLGRTTTRPISAVTITTSTSGRTARAPEVTITRTMKGQQPLEHRVEDFPALGAPSTSGTSTVHLRLNNPDSQSSKVSIHVNHKPTGSVTHITSGSSQQKATEAFPALGKPSSVPQAQWVHQKSKKHEPKSHKVAAAPQLPPSDLSQFPTLSKNSKNDKKAKKTSSITVSMNNSSNEGISKQKNNNKNNGKQGDRPSSSNAKESNSNDYSKKDDKNGELEGKGKNKKKKAKNNTDNTNHNNNKTNYNNNHSDSSALESNQVEEANEKNSSKNGIVKKRSELKIGALTISDHPENSQTSSNNSTKPPPGFSLKPPPGFDFSNFPSLGPNDLTFTSSSGQSYSITPNQNYYQPTNFTARNEDLCKKFQSVFNNNEAIQEFKKYSSLFQNGTLSADKYYDHCKEILGSKFEEVFPELLVLLPDIGKQQELYAEFNGKSKDKLLVCENCRQVIFKGELKDHHRHHTLDNHFPGLGQASQKSNVWKTN